MPGNFIRGNNRSTTSLQECTVEDFQFSPKHKTSVRRTSSLDDISRFHRYFHLVQGNLGKLFTWQQYLKILQNQLRNLETLTILGKAMLPFMQTHQTSDLKSNPASQILNYAQEPDGASVPQAPLTEIEKTQPKLLEERTSTSSVTSTQNEKRPTISTPKFDFDDLCQSAEKSVSASSNYSTISLMNRSRVMIKICSETKTLARKINKTADIIAHLPQNCTECGASIEGLRHNEHCNQTTETDGDTAENLEDIKLEDPNEEGHSDFPSVCSSKVPIFSSKSSVGAGESTESPAIPKCNPRRKGSIKLLAKLKQFVTRK